MTFPPCVSAKRPDPSRRRPLLGELARLYAGSMAASGTYLGPSGACAEVTCDKSGPRTSTDGHLGRPAQLVVSYPALRAIPRIRGATGHRNASGGNRKPRQVSMTKNSPMAARV